MSRAARWGVKHHAIVQDFEEAVLAARGRLDAEGRRLYTDDECEAIGHLYACREHGVTMAEVARDYSRYFADRVAKGRFLLFLRGTYA